MNLCKINYYDPYLKNNKRIKEGPFTIYLKKGPLKHCGDKPHWIKCFYEWKLCHNYCLWYIAWRHKVTTVKLASCFKIWILWFSKSLTCSLSKYYVRFLEVHLYLWKQIYMVPETWSRFNIYNFNLFLE